MRVYVFNMIVKFNEAKTLKDYNIASDLFKEYASQTGIDLEFQNFRKEIENLKNQYSRLVGAALIVYNELENPIGYFGVRPLEGSISELKRMCLRTEGRGKGIGKQMLNKAIEISKELGYDKMRLDTLPTMQSAIGLYKKIGFYEIDPYRFNPIARSKYFEISLNP